MKAVLEMCEQVDLVFVSEVLENKVIKNDNDKLRTELLRSSESSATARAKLIKVIDENIRYYGSSDVSYLYRLFSTSDGGVSDRELIEDVCKKMKLPVKFGTSPKNMLRDLAKKYAEKELSSIDPDGLVEAFRNFGVRNSEILQIKDRMKKNGKVAILPVIFQVLGPKVALEIIEATVVSLIAKYAGREAAKGLTKEVIKRNPWLNSLGPIMWGLSAAWLAYDLQGPAFRKTIPICLYLGVVVMRNELVEMKAAA